MSLAFLSWPSFVAAWSQPSDAEPLTLGTENDGQLTHVYQNWYYRFPLSRAANVTVKFTHVKDPVPSSTPAWSVSLLDQNVTHLFSRDSTVSDDGFTCSVDLAPVTTGTHGPYYFVLVHGTEEAATYGYHIYVSQPNLNVKIGSGSYARIADACLAANSSYNQIFPGCFTFFEDITYRGAADVVIDGGNANEGCITIIRGSLRVRDGKMAVSRVALRPPSGSATWSCESLTQ